MKVIQCSMIKNACNPGFGGGISTLFSHTDDLVDGYVVGVDRASTDGTYGASRRELDTIGKPFDLYEFDWPNDCNFSKNSLCFFWLHEPNERDQGRNFLKITF